MTAFVLGVLAGASAFKMLNMSPEPVPVPMDGLFDDEPRYDWRDRLLTCGCPMQGIRPRGRAWEVTDRSGSRVLGTHRTREGAERQLRAIHASQARRSMRGCGCEH